MFFLFYIFLLPIVVQSWLPRSSKNDSSLCRTDLCPSKTTSLGCITNTMFSESCGSGNRIIRVNGILRQEILKNVNTVRNLVASGLGNLSVAARMPTMGWDRDLAHFALVSLRQCDSEGRYCANTKKFHYVATTEINSLLKRNRNMLNHVTRKLLPTWFADVLGCRMDKDQIIQQAVEGLCIGHYIPLIQDNGDRMGCGIRTRSIPNNSTEMLTLLCHFSRANVNDMKPYKVGSIPGENCSSGKSQLYKFLCTRFEIVDHNLATATTK